VTTILAHFSPNRHQNIELTDFCLGTSVLQLLLILHGLPRRFAARNDDKIIGMKSELTSIRSSSRVPTSRGVAIHLHGLR
jgi:hypothetical protein